MEIIAISRTGSDYCLHGGQLDIKLSSGGQYQIVLPSGQTDLVTPVYQTERWIELSVLDECGSACAGAMYRIWKDEFTLIFEGTLDEQGCMHVKTIMPDECIVEIIPATEELSSTFPDKKA